ncbi:MAG: DnaJ domain-containing protein, partial [Succinivibrio sp.]|nr:DnaJ domain-containing protein [Succinivibrio sp.]
GVSRSAMDNLIRVRMAEMRFSNYYQGGYSEQSSYSGDEQQDKYTERVEEDKLAAAYQILGVDKDTPFEEIKKAHKRLMLKYHPDRLASQGLSQEMVNMYTEKAKDIQAAFDLIKKQRGE